MGEEAGEDVWMEWKHVYLGMILSIRYACHPDFGFFECPVCHSINRRTYKCTILLASARSNLFPPDPIEL